MKVFLIPLSITLFVSVCVIGIALIPPSKEDTLQPYSSEIQKNDVVDAPTTAIKEPTVGSEKPEGDEPTQDVLVTESAHAVQATVPENRITSTQETVPEQQVIVQEPFYDSPAIPFDTLNEATLPAVVNILCGSNSKTINGATGSGVVIDPRGVILTNAHVAQYILLQNYPGNPIACVIRTGMPAKATYVAEVIAFPYAWAQKHAQDVQLEFPTGTGEDDWALLYITKTTSGVPKPALFPFIPLDQRQAVTTTGDSVLVTAYPAGFLGSATLQRELWPVSTTVTIQKVYTFTQSLIDIFSLGGNIVAQGGASGGAVVNQWGKLVGIVVVSSMGDTTAERDLRAITISHINKSVKDETGVDLVTFLQQGSFENKMRTFVENSEQKLFSLYSL